MRKNMMWLLALLAPLGATSFRATAQEIAVGSTEHSAVLGSAYQSVREDFVGDACVTGRVERTGGTEATFSLEQALSYRDTSNKLALSMSGRARFGAAKASARASMARMTRESAFATSMIWVGEYKFGSRKLMDVRKTAIGESVSGQGFQWATTCGDGYVSEIVEGARFFLAIRIEFSTREDKRKFDAAFSIKGQTYSAKASIEQASRTFDGEARISIRALQIGGDTSRVSGVLGGDGGGAFVQCSFFKIQSCLDALSKAISYMGDTQNGFASTLRGPDSDGRLTFAYRTSNYTAAGIFPTEFPGATIEVLAARDEALELFEGALKTRDDLDALAERDGLSEGQRALISGERDNAQENVGMILATGEICYISPSDCRRSLDVLKPRLKPVDLTVAAPPKPPVLAFHLYSLSRGVWPRADSVAEMNKPVQVFARLTPTGCGPLLEMATPNCRVEPTAVDVAARVGSEVSEVIVLEAAALNKAELWFENWKIDEVDLAGHDFPAKDLPDGRRMLVLSSSRPTPGWTDLLITKAPATLPAHNTQMAEGILYLLIRDAFGQRFRYSLGYVKLTCFPAPQGNKSSMSILLKHRWWGPDDTVLDLSGTQAFPFARTFYGNANNKKCESPA